ncbi:MAG: deoxyhypusine synthase [Candidatus Micrarchaeota archaeon]
MKNPVRDMQLSPNMGVVELIKQMGMSGGFTASHLAQGREILQRMLDDKRCTCFLSFPACIVSTGIRGVLAECVSEFDAIITTCGTLDHDLARAWGGKYYKGSFELNDADLHKKNICRLGNILIPNSDYGPPIEKGMTPILEELVKEKDIWGPREMLHEFGKRIKDRGSILHQAAKHNIPIYVPGITDGAFGTNLLMFSEGRKFRIDILKDEKELSDLMFDTKISGALMVGGGISKHHTIWWNQFRGGLEYAVYITTATQYDGSLSGARLTEAVSWGKVKENARYVTIDGDATVLLPLLFASIKKRPSR